ncbi:MAG: S-layer homology domain-containing protein, partial [Defluviitaleaceae bacterium]|nr:S-layer homology domain-containing protein [Defluviitaleaceae bacterium]
MKKNFFRRFLALAFALIFAGSAVVYGSTDNYILSDPVANTFRGRSIADTLIQNAQYNDLSNIDASRGVAFAQALELMPTFGSDFNPGWSITRAQALGIAMRVIGRSGEALELGGTLATALGVVEPAQMLGLGYLAVAFDLGIITAADAMDGLQNATLWGWPLDGPITREEMAHLLFTAINLTDSTIFDTDRPLAAVYRFGDWQNINATYIRAVEHLVLGDIMAGDGANFQPLGHVSRGQIVAMLANMEDIIFQINGLTRKNGTVGAIRDNEFVTTNELAFWRNIFIRVGDGSVDVLQYEVAVGLNRINARDALVYFNGTIGGMGMLAEGDRIQYIVNNETNEVLFIDIVSEAVQGEVVGHLYQVNVANSVIILRDLSGNTQSFPIANGLITQTVQGNLIEMDWQRFPIDTLFYGSMIRLYLFNDVVRWISFVGQPNLVHEVRGIVVENNPDFGYLTIIDNTGRRVTMQYFEGTMRVQKQEHWDISANVGYIAQMFPGFVFNPLETTISMIRPGDIVFIRPDPNNRNIIANISAATNYIMRYGRIIQLRQNYGYMTMLMEHENGQTSWFDVAGGVFITREGRPIAANNIQVGDWARVLVNEAIVGPGHVMASVREMAIEGAARHISEIV